MRPTGSHPEPAPPVRPDRRPARLTPPLLAGSPPPTSPACSLLSSPFLFLKEREREASPHSSRRSSLSSVSCRNLPLLPAAGHLRGGLPPPRVRPSPPGRFPLGGRLGFTPALFPLSGDALRGGGGSLFREATATAVAAASDFRSPKGGEFLFFF